MAMLDSHKDLFGPFHPQTLAVVGALAIAFWRAGDIDRAIGLLDQNLDRLTSSLGREHPMRVNVLSTLGEIMAEQRHLEQASVILREVLECRVRSAGANHASSLAAKGDLAAVLFELGHELAWLLAETPSCLETDQSTIRSMLAERLNWDAARTC